jgi:isopentenyl phosphate kinase
MVSARAITQAGVSEKAAPGEPRVREDVVRRLGAEIAASAPRPLVLVHGAGSFGHRIVERTGLHRGLGEDLESRLALGETQRLQYELDGRIARILLESRLPVMPCQASASAVMCDGELETMDTAAIALMAERGLVPLLYGVPALDRVRGCSILSGDQIAPFVAARLGIGLLVHATDVDGVFEADPAREPGARRIDRIDRRNWDAVQGLLRGSRAVDVTGGMEGKVRSLLALAREGGLRSRIVDATVPGQLARALAGEPVGTLVTWGEEP